MTNTIINTNLCTLCKTNDNLELNPYNKLVCKDKKKCYENFTLKCGQYINNFINCDQNENKIFDIIDSLFDNLLN
jgi:hypothetical protein